MKAKERLRHYGQYFEFITSVPDTSMISSTEGKPSAEVKYNNVDHKCSISIGGSRNE